MSKEITTPPYLGFHVFEAGLNDLKPEEMPHPIKRKRFSTVTRSPLIQGQILNAFRYFNLVNRHDEPGYLLTNYINKQSFDPKTWYETLVNMRYQSILDGEDRSLMTIEKLDRKFAGFGINGSTKESAIKFYLKLMEAAGKPLPAELAKRPGRPSRESHSLGDSGGEILDHSEPRLTLKAARNAANGLRRDGGRRGSYRRPEDDEAELNGNDHDFGTRTPIPLGPGRLAYIELPADWSNRELKRLIRILELTFGDESEIM